MSVSLVQVEKGVHIPRKQQVILSIIAEARRMNVREMIEGMWSTDANGRIEIEGESLPGYVDEVTADELASVATAAADFELWWIRACAKQVDITCGYADWAYFNLSDDLDLADAM